MLNVALTGNIASGKSTVASRFAALGATVLDADQYAREAVAPGSGALNLVVARFGPSVLRADGALDRAALGRIVFASARARADLEAIIHPEVARRRIADTVEARANGARIVVADVPLLFEAGLAAEFDLIVLVATPDSARLDRLVRIRGLSAVDARAMMAAQDDAAIKRGKSDIVIDNDSTLEALQQKVDVVWHDLEARAARARSFAPQLLENHARES